MEDSTPKRSWLTNGNLRLWTVGFLAVLIVIMLTSPLSCGIDEQTTDDAAMSDLEGDDTNQSDADDAMMRGNRVADSPLRVWTTPADDARWATTTRRTAPLLTVEAPAQPVAVITESLSVPADEPEAATAEPAKQDGNDDSDASDVEEYCVPPTPAEEEATDVWFSDLFDADSPDWQPLSGSWQRAESSYLQSDASGYDFITQLRRLPPQEFAISVDVTAIDVLNGGLVIGQPELGSRRGATLIDFTADGSYLRWGLYDDSSGQYIYLGGAAVSSSFDPFATHRLRIESRSDRTALIVDGTEVAAIDPIPHGHIGLVTSLASVDFDRFVVEDLNQ